MHAQKEKPRGILEKKNLCIYMIRKILRKNSKEKRIAGKKKIGWAKAR